MTNELSIYFFASPIVICFWSLCWGFPFVILGTSVVLLLFVTMGLKKPDLTMSQSESVYRALSGSHGRQKDTRERKELRQFVRRKTIKYDIWIGYYGSAGDGDGDGDAKMEMGTRC